MAKTNAERQRDYRQRKAGGEQAGPKCPGCRERDGTMARWKERTSGVIRGLESERAGWKSERAALETEVDRLTDELETAQAELASQGKRCTSCGGAKACLQCARGSSWEEDFG